MIFARLSFSVWSWQTIIFQRIPGGLHGSLRAHSLPRQKEWRLSYAEYIAPNWDLCARPTTCSNVLAATDTVGSWRLHASLTHMVDPPKRPRIYRSSHILLSGDPTMDSGLIPLRIAPGVVAEKVPRVAEMLLERST